MLGHSRVSAGGTGYSRILDIWGILGSGLGIKGYFRL